jgi:hypothetical protein
MIKLKLLKRHRLIQIPRFLLTPFSIGLLSAVFGVLFIWAVAATAGTLDCSSVPMLSDAGDYQGCQVIHAGEVVDREPASVSEAACPMVCASLDEMDAMAAESRSLDQAAGFSNE